MFSRGDYSYDYPHPQTMSDLDAGTGPLVVGGAVNPFPIARPGNTTLSPDELAAFLDRSDDERS